MTWFQSLVSTYDNCFASPKFMDEDIQLLPVSHASQQAHILVRLSGDGGFLGAEILGKQTICLPATEASAGRTSGAAAHPLADKIQYCAKDYPGKNNHFDLYEKELGGWVSSPYSHPKAQAIYTYVCKGTLVADLLSQGILQADAAGRLLTEPPKENPAPIFSFLPPKNKGGKTVRDQGDALVCWQVEIPGDLEPATWKDPSLQEAWVAYLASQAGESSLCMVSGKSMPPAGQHPRNIRRPGDGAKLISSNDNSGFTFRGRFLTGLEASSVGYSVSHKAHNALRWLIARQGYRNGEQVILAWAEKGESIPELATDKWMEDEFLLEDGCTPEAAPLSVSSTDTTPSPHKDIGLQFSRQLSKTLQGYAGKLAPHDSIVILGLDAATPGRLSVTFFRELFWSDYLKTLESWQNDFYWLIRRVVPGDATDKKKSPVVYQLVAPRPDEICLAAYGKRVDDNLRKNTVARILPCIADKAQIPWDIVENCVRRACGRAGLESWEWNTVLGVACALYKGYYARQPNDEQRRKYTMALDENLTSRDYLYGRLLAVADYAERCALKAADEKRPTSAERLMQRFADYPFETWLTLEKQINSYMSRLKNSPKWGWAYYRCNNLLNSIHALFTREDYCSNSRLSGEFLLGYHCQMADLYTSKSDTETSEQIEEGNK